MNKSSQSYGDTCHTGSRTITCHPTQVNKARRNPSQTGRYSIYLPWRDERLNWPRWLYILRWFTCHPPIRRSSIQVLTPQSAVGSQTRDLLITRPTT